MSGSETLADWLRAAIDRDAEIAEAAGGTWTHECQHVDDNNQYYNDANPHPDCCRVGGSILIYDEGGHDVADAEHMIRFDPARVLRDVAAKRRLLDLHEAPCDECTSDEYVTIDGVDVPRHHGTEPCTTVLLLAQSYRDEPGWREEWDID